MKVSVLSWGTTSYTPFIFNAHFRIYRSFFRKYANSSIFRVHQSSDLAPRSTKKNILKKLHEVIVLSWGTTTCIYTIFLTPISAFSDLFFRNHINSSIFPMYQPIDLAPRSTQNFFCKNFTRTSLLNWGITTYTRTISNAYFSNYMSFIKLHKFMKLFLCVLAHGCGTSEHQNKFLKKYLDDLCVELGNYHIY